MDWRPTERVHIRWSSWSAYLLTTIAASVAGVIFAVPATRANDFGSAIVLVGIMFAIAFPIALLVCKGRYPAGHITIKPREAELLCRIGSRPEITHSLDDLKAIVLERSEESQARFAVRANFSDETITLLTADNISSAGGHVLEHEAEAIEEFAGELAKSLNVKFRHNNFRREAIPFSAIVRNTSWPVRVGAFLSTSALVYFLRGIPAIPILLFAFTVGVIVRSQTSHPAVRWLGVTLLVTGILCFFLTVVYFGQHTETPWQTPAIPRWAGGLATAFGAGVGLLKRGA